MTVDDALCLAAAALAGDRVAIRALADAIDERASAAGAFWTASAPPRLRLLANQDRPATAGGIALGALAVAPATPAYLGSLSLKARLGPVSSEMADRVSYVGPDAIAGGERAAEFVDSLCGEPDIRPVFAIR